MKTVNETERVIEQLASEDFKRLTAWMDQRRRQGGGLQSPPYIDAAGWKAHPGPEPSPHSSVVFRDHSAFRNSYAPEGEGLLATASTPSGRRVG